MVEDDGRWWLICGWYGDDIDPVVSACMGAAWSVTRVAFTIGYCRKDKSDGSGRRTAGTAANLLELALIVMSGMTGYQLIMN